VFRISSKDPQDRIEFRRLHGKIRKMIKDEKKAGERHVLR